ncbi:MAG: DnaJ domain-containing protein [Cryomorphaceae bacterium]|jgi:curved DNA-binding protein CbpA|nr:DnaJ domain-containing protein [Cryomorphaceae bacterium]
MKNPYEELKVSKDFTPKELKTQFRKLSKKYHPDKKGNPDKFINLKIAYDILSDAKKRAYYDETGLIPDEMEQNKIRTKAKESLFNLIKHVIYNPNIMDHYENMDLIVIINKAIDDNKKVITKNIKKLSKEYKTARKILLRLNHKGGPNDFIKGMIENSIKEKEDIIKNMSNDIKMLDLMSEIITEYEYNFEEVASMYSMDTFTNINNSTTTTGYM